MSTPTTTVTRTVADHLAAASSLELPADVERKTIWHTLDTVAASISGSQLLAGRRARAFADLNPMPGPAPLWGHAATAHPIQAAFVNAMAAHADETDDSHAPSISHPGCGVVPAAFAMAACRPTSGRQLLRAVAAGYDIGTRMTMALGVSTFDLRGSNPNSHAYASVFGAVAGAMVAAGMDADQACIGLSYTTQLASGVTTWLRDSEHVEKAFVFAGMPARNGVFAATIAAARWENVPDAFDHHPNFLSAVSDHPDPAVLTGGLGQVFEIMNTNIKKYAVGSPAQAAVQGAENLLAQHAFTADEVTAIEIKLPAGAAHVTDDRNIPDINTQYLVAGTLIDRGFSFAMAHDVERMEDPAIRKLRDVSTIVPDPTTDGTRSATVSISLVDGRQLRLFVPHVRGTVDDPMTEEEIVRKTTDIVEPVLGGPGTRRFLDVMLDLGSLADIADLGPIVSGSRL
jgi:2-methylcitrate dehydratase PrpD